VRFWTQYIEQLPIRTINFDDPADKARHDQMVALVERMLELHRQLAEAKLPQARTVLQRQIDAIDRQIDRLVYELYDFNGGGDQDCGRGCGGSEQGGQMMVQC